MLTSARRESYSSLEDTLTIPGGASFVAPPPVEDRLYTVPGTVEAYTPTGKQGRSVTEIANTCLSADEFTIIPDPKDQNIFRLRRELGKIIVENVVSPANLLSEIFETDMRDSINTSETYVRSVDIARVGNRALRVSREPGLRTLTKEVVATLNPDFLTKSPLHQKAGDDIKLFKNTGNETYVLPRDYEASVRMIPVGAAAAWLRAFQNWPEWFRRGFNYVPIEPIEDIVPTDDPARVAAMTTNLRGIPFRTVVPLMSQHENQLYEMSEQILSGLSGMRIAHNDIHGSNFIVVPYTKPSGRPDLSRCPRLYLIDFEDAEIIQ